MKMNNELSDGMKLFVFSIDHGNEKLIVSIQQLPHGQRGTWLFCLIWQSGTFCSRYTETEIPMLVGDDPDFWDRIIRQYIRKLVLRDSSPETLKKCGWMLMFDKSIFRDEMWTRLNVNPLVEVKKGEIMGQATEVIE